MSNPLHHNGHLTAIARSKMSAPMANLLKLDLLCGDILDFGCGRGSDVELVRPVADGKVEGYDPYHRPTTPNGLFDTITCNFVLNVIPDEDERALVVLQILSLLKIGGSAYITVRDDKKSLKGWTSKKTWQGLIELDLPVMAHKKGQYKTYLLQ